MQLLSLNVALFESNNELLTPFLQTYPQLDFACFQEATRRVDASTQPGFISKEALDEGTAELKYSFYAPITVIKNFEVQDFHQREHFSVDFGGFLEFGYYFRSKAPIMFGKNVFVQNEFSYVTDWSSWPNVDRRAVQVVDVVMGVNQKLRLMNYHGIWSKNKQDSDMSKSVSRRLLELAKEVDYPVILCGDFNLFPETESIRIISAEMDNLVDRYGVNKTRPESNELNGAPRNVIDYIFVSKGITVNQFSVPDVHVSDHLPLFLDFELTHQ